MAIAHCNCARSPYESWKRCSAHSGLSEENPVWSGNNPPPSAANHGEEHFEALFCIERMGNSRGHDEHFACFHDVWRAAEEDLSLAVEDRHRGIKGSRVFGQTLSGIEGKERERTGVVAKNLARNDAAFCVFH